MIMDLFKLAAKISRVEKVLISHGDFFSGGCQNAAREARQWVDRGFDAIDVDSWCSVNVWDAQAAKAWCLAGMTPDDVTAAAATVSSAVLAVAAAAVTRAAAAAV